MSKKLKKNKSNLSKSAVAFYIMAAISFIIFIYSMYSVKVYLDSLIDAGSITWAANWADMLGYYVGSSNGFTYLLFAVLLTGVGYIISLVKKGTKMPVIAEETVEVFPTPVEETKEENKETVQEEV